LLEEGGSQIQALGDPSMIPLDPKHPIAAKIVTANPVVLDDFDQTGIAQPAPCA